jgi:hypothetical protein
MDIALHFAENVSELTSQRSRYHQNRYILREKWCASDRDASVACYTVPEMQSYQTKRKRLPKKTLPFFVLWAKTQCIAG